MLPLLRPHCSLDVCNELATHFTIHDAIKIFSKLSVSESESIVLSGVWKVLGLLLFLPAANATSKRVKTYLRAIRTYERVSDIYHISPGRMKIRTLNICLPVLMYCISKS